MKYYICKKFIIIPILFFFSFGLSGCKWLEKECFDVSYSTDGSYSDLDKTGDTYCKNHGYDESTSVKSSNGEIYEICCKGFLAIGLFTNPVKNQPLVKISDSSETNINKKTDLYCNVF